MRGGRQLLLGPSPYLKAVTDPVSIPFSLVGKPEGKRSLGRPRRRWMDNIKMDRLEIGLNVVDWIGLAQDRYR
jgi:hypothetical protein